MRRQRATLVCALLSFSVNSTLSHTFTSATRHIHTFSPKKLPNSAVQSSAPSPMRFQLDTISAPSGDALTVSSAAEYLDQLRKVHRSLGVAPAASQLRYSARKFLQSIGSSPQTMSWPMTEKFAHAIINASVHFEVVVFECPYGQRAVEHLMMLWKGRRSGTEEVTDSSVGDRHTTVIKMTANKEIAFSDVSALGRLVMAAVTQINNGTLSLRESERLLLSQFLCDALLPAAVQFISTDFFHSSSSAIPMSAAEAEAFSVLLAALTKAAVTKWARQEGGRIVFGPPTEKSGFDVSPSPNAEVCLESDHTATCESVGQGVPIAFTKLAHAMERFASDFSSMVFHETALPVLRFFTLTHSIPVFIDHSAMCESDVASVASSLVKVFIALLDPKVLLASHQVSSVASTYAHILTYNLISTGCRTYSALLDKLRHVILHDTEALSPVTVLLSLCERVTPEAKRYLFSDTAALLSALAKIYHLVYTLYRSSGETASSPRVPYPKVPTSRFERRRSTLPANKSLPSSVAAEESVHTPHSSPNSPPPTLVVSIEDLAEIDGELEALLNACVTVTAHYMPCAPGMKSRPVLLGIRGDQEELVRVASCEAKERGGKSRIAKKTAGNRELVMIAEALHALSWRHFAAFQERLYTELIASRGQLELRPAQYATLLRILLRAPPALPSAVFHCVSDRLKRVIHAESITSPLGEVICAEHARLIQDHPPLSLHDACAVVFDFAKKLHGSSLPLLHDLLVRCSQRVKSGIESSTSISLSSSLSDFSSSSAAVVVGCAMFIVSATKFLHADAREEPALRFIADARDKAATHVAALDAANVKEILCREMSISTLAHAALLLGDPNEGEPHDVHAVRELLRASFHSRVLECDCMELAQFLSEYFASVALHIPLPSWMIAAIPLERHFTGSQRLPALTLLPLLVKESGEGETAAVVMHAVEVTRLYCRTFATLVATLQILHLADSALLADAAVLQMVLRKITQLIRRTAYSKDLFAFFALYGDCPEVVSASTSELVPESQCFVVKQKNVASLASVHEALQSIARLRSRQLRQRWLSVLSPLIVPAVAFATDTPDAVLDVAELVAPDDPALVQCILRSSQTIRQLHMTYSSTAEGATLLRILMLLQGGSRANSTVRELHRAAARALEGPYHRTAPVEQLAQAMMLPSLEGTVVVRRLRRNFTLRVEKLLGSGAVSEGEQRWDEALDKLELDHWLTLLQYHFVGEVNSHRFEMELQERKENDEKRRLSRSQSAKETKPKTTTTTALGIQRVTHSEGNAPLLLQDSEVQKEQKEDVTRRRRGLFLVLGFTPSSVMKLRTSLGASQFIRFVNELLRETAQVVGVDCTLPESGEKQTSTHGEEYFQSHCLWMSDGTLSPLCHKGVRPFVSLAMGLVEAISGDLDGFVRQEEELINSQCKGNKTGKQDVLIDLEAVLQFALLMDLYNPALCEQRQLESYNAEDIFSCEKGLPLRYLYRLLLKLPSQWGRVGTTTSKSSVRLCNISAVLDYTAGSSKGSALDDFADEQTFYSLRSELGDIFGNSRPLLMDVCMPIAEVYARQHRQRTLSKNYLFDALMQCLIHADEPPAATRARLATLGPRDISRVVQAICGETYAKHTFTPAVADGAVDILTDLLPSSSAEDLYDVVRTLLPLLESQAAVAEAASLSIRRLLAHVAVVMGNDTERFPLEILYDILQRLHEPHALVSAAAARRMLAGLNADTESEKEKENDVENNRASKGTYTLTVSLLRSIVSANQYKANIGRNELNETYEDSVFCT